MNFQPLLEQIERLNRNLETWIGLVATANAKPAGVTDVEEFPSNDEPKAESAAEKPRGRPKKRYWFNSDLDAVQENAVKPGDAWVELTKAKFEETRARIENKGKADTKPAAKAPSEDPFADDDGETKVLTIDDVRDAVFKVRDKHGMDRARGLISKYAEKMDKVKPEHYAALIADAEAALGGDDDL